MQREIVFDVNKPLQDYSRLDTLLVEGRKEGIIEATEDDLMRTVDAKGQRRNYIFEGGRFVECIELK